MSCMSNQFGDVRVPSNTILAVFYVPTQFVINF
jgi:hypothetical protein